MKLPKPDTRTAKAIEFVRKCGVARSPQIAQEIGVPTSSVTAMLAPYVETGVLVSCIVSIPGSRPQREYRIGAGGRMADAQDANAVRKSAATAFDHDDEKVITRKEKPVACNLVTRAPRTVPAAPKTSAPIAPKPIEASALRCALLLDGTLRIHSTAGTVVLNKRDTETLLRFLGSPIRLGEGA